jgi:NADP-dependent 3-hydroxy acid dehydrogenase YdfG
MVGYHNDTKVDQPQGVAVVTGASSGIGAATVRSLTAMGFDVIAAARRRDRLDALAAETGCRPFMCDITDDKAVADLAEAARGCRVLINNAGGAIGLEPVARADLDAWSRMYALNVIGTVRVTKALLPELIASEDGVVVNVTSLGGHIVYEGGAGYTAAKHGIAAVTETLRLELCGKPVRITDLAPGLVRTEEFGLNRFDGDQTRADAVYAGIPGVLTAEDVADAIAWIVTRPWHVNVDMLVLKPRAQASRHKVYRE